MAYIYTASTFIFAFFPFYCEIKLFFTPFFSTEFIFSSFIRLVSWLFHDATSFAVYSKFQSQIENQKLEYMVKKGKPIYDFGVDQLKLSFYCVDFLVERQSICAETLQGINLNILKMLQYVTLFIHDFFRPFLMCYARARTYKRNFYSSCHSIYCISARMHCSVQITYYMLCVVVLERKQ